MLRVRLRGYRPDTIPVAGCYNLIGAGYLKNNRLQEAEEATQRSLAIYEAIYAIDEDDAASDEIALSRGKLAEIYEALGRFTDAKETPLLGESEDRMVCASDRVSLLVQEQISQCLS
jgi:tetratricopeptide (TPR) repeat protein